MHLSISGTAARAVMMSEDWLPSARCNAPRDGLEARHLRWLPRRAIQYARLLASDDEVLPALLYNERGMPVNTTLGAESQKTLIGSRDVGDDMASLFITCASVIYFNYEQSISFILMLFTIFTPADCRCRASFAFTMAKTASYFPSRARVALSFRMLSMLAQPELDYLPARLRYDENIFFIPCHDADRRRQLTLIGRCRHARLFRVTRVGQMPPPFGHI